MKVKTITKEKLFREYNAGVVDLVKDGIFTEVDYREMCDEFGIQNVQTKMLHIVKVELINAIKNPIKLLLNLKRILMEQLNGIKKFYEDDNRELNNKYPISDYSMKASVIRAFKPKSVLEIGTWHGWGISAIKFACPEAICYTMNPKENKDANNPINEKEIGRVYKNLKLDIKQIWADSKTYDYKSIKSVDVCYIDGNHEYDYALSDLKNCTNIAKKAVILDDYIPSPDSNRGYVMTWGWNNKEVVNARLMTI